MTQKQTPAGSPRNLRSEVAALLRLGVPILLTQVGVVVVSFADTMMVGGYSTEALAAAAFVNNFFMVPMVMLMGFAAGLTPIIGSLYSRRRHSDVGRTLAAGLRLNVAAAVALMAIMGILFFVLDRMGQPAELLPLIRSYYLIVMASMLPAPFFNACQQTANAVTDTATPMWIILGANALNILGNWLLIYGHWGLPELGLDGAGISTFVARLAATLAIMRVVTCSRRYSPYAAGLHRRGSRPLTKRILGTSLPVMMQNGAEVLIWAFGAVVCGWFGKIELAAYQITNTLSQLGFMAYISFGIALSIRVANKMGLRDYQGIRLSTRAGVGLNLFLAVMASLIFFFFARPLLSAFTPNGAVVSVAVMLVLPLIAYQLFDAVQVTLSNAVRGTGIVWPLLTVSVLAYMIVGMPAMLGLAHWGGLQCVGVYWSFVIMLAVAFMAYLYYFLRIISRHEREAGIQHKINSTI